MTRSDSRKLLILGVALFVVCFALIVVGAMALSANGATAHPGHHGVFTCADGWHYGRGHSRILANARCIAFQAGGWGHWGWPR